MIRHIVLHPFLAILLVATTIDMGQEEEEGIIKFKKYILQLSSARIVIQHGYTWCNDSIAD